jgi:hypothetical protein
MVHKVSFGERVADSILRRGGSLNVFTLMMVCVHLSQGFTWLSPQPSRSWLSAVPSEGRAVAAALHFCVAAVSLGAPAGIDTLTFFVGLLLQVFAATCALWDAGVERLWARAEFPLQLGWCFLELTATALYWRFGVAGYDEGC